MASFRKLAVAAVVALLVSAPRLAVACSVCTSGREEENQLAFLLTTLFLSVLPPACVGFAVWWIVRRAREVEQARAAAAPDGERPAPTNPTPRPVLPAG